MKPFEEKKGTHIVIKWQDVNDYLSLFETEKLQLVLNSIMLGRREDDKNPTNEYYVVNKDEPYADEVFETIKRGEMEKENK